MSKSRHHAVRASTQAAVIFGLLLAAADGVFGQSHSLDRLTLEDLLQVEVSSVSRKAQPMGRTAAAVYVITQEDIRRSGAQTIPDLLRMVPGFNIAQVNSGTWAVSARGLPEVYSNKLLVLVDGRSVYTPLFGGVDWDMLSVPLAEIERIEVVRGPGGSVWGANATNGVVNIITKSAEATHGGLVTVEFGGQHPSDLQLRYGGALGTRAHYRAYVRRVVRGFEGDVQGIRVQDPGESVVGGTRFDLVRGPHRFSLQGSAQSGHSEVVRTFLNLDTFVRAFRRERTEFGAHSLVLGWTHTAGPRSESAVQAYYDHQRRESSFEDAWHTFDIEARHRRKFGSRHDVVAGGGFRFWDNDVTNAVFKVLPASEQLGTVSGFVQDEVELVKDRLRATAGVKLEHSRLARAAFQPTARLTWTPDRSHAFWGAFSRAVRMPTRVDRGMFVPIGGGRGPGGRPLLVTLEGNPEFRPEILRAAEAGYRLHRGTISLDTAVFSNRYDDLTGVEAGPLARSDEPPDSWRVPLMFTNSVTGRSSGVEVSGTWRIAYQWKVMGSYTFLSSRSRSEVAAIDSTLEPKNGEQHQFHIRNYVDLPGGFEASLSAYRVTAVASGAEIPAYSRVDARIGWLRGPLEISAGAQNLGHGGREFIDVTGNQSQDLVPRGFLRGAFRF